MHLFLYWHIWWFDILVHTLGGVVVALGLFALRDLRVFPNTWLRLIPVTALVICIALIWEGFELVAGIPNAGNYVTDTLIDVAVGVFGGVLGYFIGNSLRNLR